MHHLRRFRILGSRMAFLISVLAFVSAAFAQEIKKEPVKASNPSSGAAMFKQYCAVCHGVGGKGDGPAASALKQAPLNLSTLAKRHGGEFPDDYVTNVLRNGVMVPVHGDAEMPVWGPLFSTINSDPALVSMRIANLTAYVKSLQVK